MLQKIPTEVHLYKLTNTVPDALIKIFNYLNLLPTPYRPQLKFEQLKLPSCQTTSPTYNHNSLNGHREKRG